MARFLSTFALISSSRLAFAQETVTAAAQDAEVFSTPSFLAALLVGFILAVAFQVLLTHLSIATGASALKPVTTHRSSEASSHKTHENEGVMGTVRKISTAYGVWTLVTASLALFAASWLAVEICQTTSGLIGAVLGLSIWGLFYMAMTSFQVNAVSSLVGSLVHTASEALRSVGSAAGSMFSRSPETRAAKTAAEMAASVREELFGDMDIDDVRAQIRKVVKDIRPAPIDARQIRDELARLFNDTEIRAMTVYDDKLDREQLVYRLQMKYGAGPQARAAMEAAKNAASVVKQEASAHKRAADKAVDSALRLTGMSSEEAERLRQQWENYLRSTGKQELNPDNIKREVEMLIKDPQAAKEALRTRASEAFNRSTITSVLSQRQDMSPEEAERTVSWIDQIIQEIRQRGQGTQQSLDAAKSSAVTRVRQYLDSLNRPELKYDGIRDDLSRLFHDPRAGADALLQRFKSLDRESIKALLASTRQDMSPEDAEHVIQQIEAARDRVVNKAQAMKAEVERRLAQAKEEALRQAEETRKTAATAAWWTFLTAVGSGAAAVSGALLAIR